jgi:ferritin
VNYLLDRDARVDFTEVSAPQTQFPDHVAPIKLALEQERKVTVDIADLFTVARETHDYLAEQFLQWFLEEQVEEEASMSDLLAVAERTREIPVLLEEYLARESPGEKE